MSASDRFVGFLVGVGCSALAVGAITLATGDDDDHPVDAIEADEPEPAPEGVPYPATATDVPLPEPVSCPASTVTVSTAEGLQAALDGAAPGDTIALSDGVYVGKFVATASGSEQQPIHLCGGEGAVLDGDGIREGYVLHLDGVSHWRLSGFTIRNGQKGVMADATSHSVIHGLTVHDIGDEAIHLRSASTYNVVLHNTIRRTGLRRDKFGEGVYIGSATSNWEKYSAGGPDRSDFNVVAGNDIAETGSESIDVKEGTTGGTVIANVMNGAGMTGADSLLDVKGNGWLIEGNVGIHAEEAMQTHRILAGWGSDNVFRANTIDVDGDGVHVYIHDPALTTNVVECSNVTSNGDAIKSNVECIAG